MVRPLPASVLGEWTGTVCVNVSGLSRVGCCCSQAMMRSARAFPNSGSGTGPFFCQGLRHGDQLPRHHVLDLAVCWSAYAIAGSRTGRTIPLMVTPAVRQNAVALTREVFGLSERRHVPSSALRGGSCAIGRGARMTRRSDSAYGNWRPSGGASGFGVLASCWPARASP